MNTEEEYIETLIGKVLVGEASEAEAAEVKNWCARSSENQKYLEDAQLIYDKAQLPGQPEFESDLAWMQVKDNILPFKKKTYILHPFMKIAAGLVLLLGLSYLFYLIQTPAQDFQFVSENQPITQLMPDETEIVLNSNSEIQVSYHERKNTGSINLIGEALISIPPTKKVNWKVTVGELQIEDIGTVFLVKAFPDNPVVEVSVQEGVVRFYAPGQDGLTLQAGEKGSYDKESNTFSIASADPNMAYLKSRALFFHEESLGNVISKLEEIFDQVILMEGDIAGCKLSVTFENEDLNTILSIISETLGIEIVQENNQIRLIGDGCY